MSLLTKKERMFVAVYSKTGNATEAARQAYDVSPKNANKLAYNLKHKARIKQALETAVERLNLTPEYILKGFKTTAEQHFYSNPNASLRATENIAKIMNLYPSNKSLSVDNTDNIKSISWQD